MVLLSYPPPPTDPLVVDQLLVHLHRAERRLRGHREQSAAPKMQPEASRSSSLPTIVSGILRTHRDVLTTRVDRDDAKEWLYQRHFDGRSPEQCLLRANSLVTATNTRTSLLAAGVSLKELDSAEASSTRETQSATTVLAAAVQAPPTVTSYAPMRSQRKKVHPRRLEIIEGLVTTQARLQRRDWLGWGREAWESSARVAAGMLPRRTRSAQLPSFTFSPLAGAQIQGAQIPRRVRHPSDQGPREPGQGRGP